MPVDLKRLRVVHYLNQFFGKEGGEEKAHIPFLVKEGPLGPGMALQKILGERGEVVSTLVCGDNYLSQDVEKASREGVELIVPYKPDLVIAGPAFEAGRYGVACGAMCKASRERLGIPAVTGMFKENPGVELYRKEVYICKTERSTLKMVEDLTLMVNLGLKLALKEKGKRLLSGETAGRPEEDHYFPRGLIKNEIVEKTAAERSVEMLLSKLRGEPFQPEAKRPEFHAFPPPLPMGRDLSRCEIALISDGGLVPRGNPDRLRSRGNLIWAKYWIDDFWPGQSQPSSLEISHTGYFPVDVLKDPNRLVPVDILRDLEKEGRIGRLHPFFYSTSGCTTSQARCQEMGEEMAKELWEKKVDGVILTST
jgi:glycine reductase